MFVCGGSTPTLCHCTVDQTCIMLYYADFMIKENSPFMQKELCRFTIRRCFEQLVSSGFFTMGIGKINKIRTHQDEFVFINKMFVIILLEGTQS